MNGATLRKYSLRQWIFVVIWAMLGPLVLPSHTAESTTPPTPEPEFRLRLFHTHTQQHLDLVYRVGDRYLPDALNTLNHFLADFRTGTLKPFDPRLFDLLHDLTEEVGRPETEINILSAYRSPESNAFLRRTTTGVAKHSLHMQAEAIDIRVPEIKTSQLRKVALAMKRGGVGYYPRSNFIHVDVGDIRRW
jgi:uncharacterized protein YcbK (DUF882 family)